MIKKGAKIALVLVIPVNDFSIYDGEKADPFKVLLY
jgi:hypothetical protein